MKNYKTEDIRNIAIVGGSGSGKTTLSESILFEAGVIKRRGSVNSKNTVSDTAAVELEYGYSVYSTVFSVEMCGKKFNFFDCPGADDFSGQAVTALNICDSAVLLVNGSRGVDVGLINSYRLIKKLGKPAFFVINYVDSDKCEYDSVVEQIRSTFGTTCVAIQFPEHSGPSFNSIIDVLVNQKLTFSDGSAPKAEDIPGAIASKAQSMRDSITESAAENDEELMEKFFDQGELSTDEIRAGFRKGIESCGLFPIVCTSAAQNVGVSRLVEFLANVAPSPLQGKPVADTKGETVGLDAAGTSLFFFKTSMEPHIGAVSYFKVMCGKAHEGQDMVNADRGSKERVAQLFVSQGNSRVQVPELVAGDLGCTVKLKDVRTGNTLNEGADHSFNFIKYPNSKFSRALKPVNEADMEKMMTIVNRMREEDPTLVIEQSKELRQVILYGQGEFHLRTFKWCIENNDKMMIVFEEPKIPYRETITKAARADYRHKKQSGGAGQFGEVHLIVEPYEDGKPMPEVFRFGNQEFKMSVKGVEEYPLDWGGKLVYVNSIVGGSIDARFMPAILKGIMQRMEQGPLTGSYARDVRVIVYDGKMHPVDSNEISFLLAGRNAFSAAFKEAGPKILEPVYDVEVLVPAEYMGDVMSDLQGRRGMIMGMESEGNYQTLKAKVPLKEMATYSTSLSSITGGSGSFVMSFSSYELVPTDVQDKLIKEFEAKQKEEE
ncbi:MAG: elongation factor G [Bacteroidaceae bacterium]|nr:elongation factor G [Bacteroidaceae bacterium]MBO7588419.1 elongation factor G [Bacteroidaceae bacterium]